MSNAFYKVSKRVFNTVVNSVYNTELPTKVIWSELSPSPHVPKVAPRGHGVTPGAESLVRLGSVSDHVKLLDSIEESRRDAFLRREA